MKINFLYVFERSLVTFKPDPENSLSYGIRYRKRKRELGYRVSGAQKFADKIRAANHMGYKPSARLRLAGVPCTFLIKSLFSNKTFCSVNLEETPGPETGPRIPDAGFRNVLT